MGERARVTTRREREDRDLLYSSELLAALTAGAAFGFASSVFYLLPKFLTEIGAGAVAIGAVSAAYGAATLAATPLIAVWIDAIPRVALVRFGALLTFVTSLAFVGVSEFGLAMLSLRAAQGVAFACFFTGLTALVTELAPARRLSEALGLAGASMLIMNAIAPAVVEPLAERFGWSSAFVAAAAMSVLAIVAARASPRRTPGRAGADVSGLVALLVQRRTLHYAAITAAVGAAFGVMFTFPQPYALALGMSSVRGFFVAYCTCALAARVSLGRLSDRLGRFRVAVFALNLYTLVVLATAGLRPGLLEVLGALLGLAHGLFFPAFNAIVITAAKPHERGKIVTVFTAAFYGGLAVATLPLGALADVAGYPAVFTASAAITFAAGGLLVFSREFGTTAGAVEIDTPAELPGGAALPQVGDKDEQFVEQSCAICLRPGGRSVLYKA
jgi:predicted MFS family arabinose efflux permease